MELLSTTSARFILFLCGTSGLTAISWRPLHNPRCHGFYRFLVFEIILTLVLLNLPFWFENPFLPRQLLSWGLLLLSIFLVLGGLFLLKKFGGRQRQPIQAENFAFENTGQLVSRGIFRYIRHPMYSSLLLLAWGAFFKHVTPLTLAAVLLTTALLVVTAKVEERECLRFFGQEYRHYQRGTKMFIPFIF